MAGFRVEKNTNYTTMSNYHLRDRELSLKAKGLLSLFLSLPEEWHYSVRGIASICKEGVGAINSTLKELESKGYLTRRQIRQENGRMGGTEYVIYEQPEADAPDSETSCTETPHGKEPCTGNSYTEKLDTANSDPEESCPEKPAQINKEKTNKERTNTEMNKKRERKSADGDRQRYGRYQNVRLSEKEMEELMKEFPKDYQERIDRLSEYMASTGKLYKNHLATIRSWAKRDEEKKAVKAYDHSKYHFSEGESL